MSSTFELSIIKITYCGFAAKVKGHNKVVYGAKFPASSGTFCPNLTTSSTDSDLVPDTVDRQTFIDFVNSQQTRQVNGHWKGGAWGTNNFTVTSKTWLPDLWIGDSLVVTKIKEGVIKFSPNPFTESQEIIKSSETTCWSCNAEWNGNSYAVYLTDNPMPQNACDKLFIWGSPKHLKIKVLLRGSGPNVDSPNRIIPGAGEHVEPGQDDSKRAQAIFAINQELGIPESTLSKCYLIPMGTYSSPGRDPRYWSYTMKQNDQVIKCGIERASSTFAQIVFIETTDFVEPAEQEQEDKVEIKNKWWEDLESILSAHTEDEWMLEDHMKFIPDAIKKIEEFRKLSDQEKQNFKF